MKQEIKGIFEEQKFPEEAWESAAPLIDHIVSNYHHPLAVILRKLRLCICEAAKKASMQRQHQFATLQACLSELCLALAMQMIKEDGTLFPMIRRFEEHRTQGSQTDGLGTDIGTRIRFARAEYARVRELLAQIRGLIPLCPCDIPPIAQFFDLTEGHICRQLHLTDQVLFCMVESWSQCDWQSATRS